jgi:hypothetical protein
VGSSLARTGAVTSRFRHLWRQITHFFSDSRTFEGGDEFASPPGVATFCFIGFEEIHIYLFTSIITKYFFTIRDCSEKTQKHMKNKEKLDIF